MKLQRHSIAELYVHLVWTTKKREQVLSSEIWQTISAVLYSSQHTQDYHLVAAGGSDEHLHLLIRYRADKAVSDLVRGIKAALSYSIRRQSDYPDFQWQDGYGAFSVSAESLEPVIHYIQIQSIHHAETKIA